MATVKVKGQQSTCWLTASIGQRRLIDKPLAPAGLSMPEFQCQITTITTKPLHPRVLRGSRICEEKSGQGKRVFPEISVNTHTLSHKSGCSLGENYSTSTFTLRRPKLVLVSGSSLPRACAHVKESLARPIPGIADAGKNAVMKVVIGSGRMNGILRDWGILGQAGEVCNGAMRWTPIPADEQGTISAEGPPVVRQSTGASHPYNTDAERAIPPERLV
ncbi:unnamed protein product [Leuciscus chuanchicus]